MNEKAWISQAYDDGFDGFLFLEAGANDSPYRAYADCDAAWHAGFKAACDMTDRYSCMIVECLECGRTIVVRDMEDSCSHCGETVDLEPNDCN